MSLPPVAVIILNWNGFADTLECLESVFKNTYPNYSVIVVDNASHDNELEEIRDFLKAKSYKLKAIFFVQNEKNLGFSEGNNIGIRKAIEDGAEYIFTLNNDTVVDPNFLVEAVKQAPLPSQGEGLGERSGEVGIVATTMLSYHDRTKIDSLGHDLLTTGDTIPRGRGSVIARSPPEADDEAISDSPGIASLLPVARNDIMGACAGAALYSVSMLEEIGLFDPDFFLNYEDSDLSLRALVNGWKITYCPTSIVYHKGQASIGKIKDTAYRIRSQRNMLWAYFNNIPLPVILLNLPWMALRDLLAILFSILLLRWNVTKILICSRWKVLMSLPMIIRKRRKNLKDRKISWFWIWKNQRSWVGVYWEYLKAMLSLRGRTK